MAGTQGKVAVVAGILLVLAIAAGALILWLPRDNPESALNVERPPVVLTTRPVETLAPEASVLWISLTPPAAPAVRGEGYIGPMRIQPTGRDYAVGQGWDVGVRPYTDRRYKLLRVPDEYRGLAYIQMRQDDKMAVEGFRLTVEVATPAIVYIARDDRLPSLPEWMLSFVNTGDELSTDDEMKPTYSIYAKPVPKGKIALGPNYAPISNSCMYMVFLKQLKQEEYERLSAAGGEPTSRPAPVRKRGIWDGVWKLFK